MIKSDNLIPLLGGTYKARNNLGDYEVCENLFPELNPDTAQSPTPVAHYPREGLRPLSIPPSAGPGRGVFTMSNGALYAVVGPNVYSISTQWKWTKLGSILVQATPVSMADNGTNAVLVDGSNVGYSIHLGTNAFAQISDPTGTFLGSNWVDFADTFLAFSVPNTNRWMTTLSNTLTFNQLVQANKDSTPDAIQVGKFNIRQMWLLGSEGSEVWYNAGSSPFAYQEWPNVFVPYGIAAKHSLVQADINLYWISQNPQGQVIALVTNGYGVEAVSTRALEYEWSNYKTVADCIGGTFQQAGHIFVIFHFPTANKTWAYDLSSKQWHRRTFTDSNGVTNREKVSFYASVGAQGGYSPTIVGQDWQTGQIYALDPTVYTDNGVQIVRKRTFPHILSNMLEITHTSLIIDFATGGIIAAQESPPLAPDFNSDFNSDCGPPSVAPILQDPLLSMRYSNDGGSSWGNYRTKGLISSGYYRSLMRFRGLGMARDRVYELMWSYNGPSALFGAYLDPIRHSA